MGSTLTVSHTIRNHAHHTLTKSEDGKGVPAGGVGVFYTVRIGINGKGNIITDGDGMIAAHEFSIANVRDLQIAVKQDFKQRKQRGSYFSAFDICYFPHKPVYSPPSVLQYSAHAHHTDSLPAPWRHVPYPFS